MAAAAADFLRLAKWLAAADLSQYTSVKLSVSIQLLCKIFIVVMFAYLIYFSLYQTYDGKNFSSLSGHGSVAKTTGNIIYTSKPKIFNYSLS